MSREDLATKSQRVECRGKLDGPKIGTSQAKSTQHATRKPETTQERVAIRMNMAIVCFTLDETKQTTAGATSVQPKEDKESLTRGVRVDEEAEERNTREGTRGRRLEIERLRCDE